MHTYLSCGNIPTKKPLRITTTIYIIRVISKTVKTKVSFISKRVVSERNVQCRSILKEMQNIQYTMSKKEKRCKKHAVTVPQKLTSNSSLATTAYAKNFFCNLSICITISSFYAPEKKKLSGSTHSCKNFTSKSKVIFFLLVVKNKRNAIAVVANPHCEKNAAAILLIFRQLHR